MIISASRRTDIPALYPDWFINRLKAGFLLTRNPLNRTQISQINLAPDKVDCIVFWTKNPQPIFKYLNYLNSYYYYFHFTLTPYNSTIEINLPDKKRLLDFFKKLSDIIGPERIIWRYDPVFYTEYFNYSTHLQYFEDIASNLSGYTEKCIYSFLTVYKKCEKNMKSIKFCRPPVEDIIKLSEGFARISESAGIKLQTCADDYDLTCFGITRGKCIDDELITKISGKQLHLTKDRNQRVSCLCVPSVDIGAYNTCTHCCLYCYANYDHDIAYKKFINHNPYSEILTDGLKGDETIIEKKDIKKDNNQLKLF